MQSYICARCGAQFAETEGPPERCQVCDDPRQYLGPKGQEWTTMSELSRTSRNVFRPIEAGLTGISTEPVFAIGQRAMLISTSGGQGPLGLSELHRQGDGP